MKNLFLICALALTAFAYAPKAEAVVQAQYFRQVYNTSTTAILTNVYTEMFSSIPKGVTSISVLNTGASPIVLALGAAGSEVNQLVIAANTDVPVVIPLQTGYGLRMSAISLTANNDLGQLQVNLLY